MASTVNNAQNSQTNKSSVPPKKINWRGRELSLEMKWGIAFTVISCVFLSGAIAVALTAPFSHSGSFYNRIAEPLFGATAYISISSILLGSFWFVAEHHRRKVILKSLILRGIDPNLL